MNSDRSSSLVRNDANEMITEAHVVEAMQELYGQATIQNESSSIATLSPVRNLTSDMQVTPPPISVSIPLDPFSKIRLVDSDFNSRIQDTGCLELSRGKKSYKNIKIFLRS